MPSLLLLALPFITGLIGWLTNWVAIRMLFHPRRPIGLGPLRLHGLLPRRQKEMAAQVGEIVEREVLSQQLVHKLMSDIDLAPHLKTFAHRLVHEGLGKRLTALPMVGGFINATTLGMLESMVAEELEHQAEPLKHEFATEAEKRIRVRELIEERIANFDLDQLERVVTEVAGREFRAIEWLGGLLGFAVGIVQLLLLVLTGSIDTNGL